MNAMNAQKTESAARAKHAISWIAFAGVQNMKRMRKNDERMTVEEALHVLGYPLQYETCDWTEAEEIAKEALVKAEKYRWHDLRKNPDDLPEESHNVIFATIDGNTQEGQRDCLSWTQYRRNAEINNQEVIAWREIEPFEE